MKAFIIILYHNCLSNVHFNLSGSEEDLKLYLLHNGTDNSSCGQYVSTACQTFPWTLGVYSKSRMNGTLPTLHLITDVSFEVGPEIVVKI